MRIDDQRRGGVVGPAGTAASAAAGSVDEENAALRRRMRELEEERDLTHLPEASFMSTPDTPSRSSRDRKPSTGF